MDAGFGLCGFGLCGFGLCGFGLCGFGLCGCGLCGFGLCHLRKVVHTRDRETKPMSSTPGKQSIDDTAESHKSLHPVNERAEKCWEAWQSLEHPHPVYDRKSSSPLFSYLVPLSGYNKCLRIGKWTRTVHRRCFYKQKRVFKELLLQCTYRDEGIGVISPEVLMQHILPHVEVVYFRPLF